MATGDINNDIDALSLDMPLERGARTFRRARRLPEPLTTFGCAMPMDVAAAARTLAPARATADDDSDAFVPPVTTARLR